MKKTVIVNIYNFIRMSHVEPSVFIPDDFETVRKQMILIRQYDLPATYALKYDALMEPRYQELIKTYAGSRDEISAWWEITEALCVKAGVDFCGAGTEEYDDRVNSAYCIGYGPEERKKLVDAYMADFYQVFGFYPKTIGSWVLDTVTVSYAAEKYGILGSAICRDQMGTDGFTLWGGFPNGIYYPSRKNENIPEIQKRVRFRFPCSGCWDRIPFTILNRMCAPACREFIPWSLPGSSAGTRSGFPGISGVLPGKIPWGWVMPM